MRDRIALIVATAGLLPATALAQNLDENLVINPNFENVDLKDPGPFGSVRILDWLDVDGDGDDTFAYFYSQGYSGANVPDGGGDFHFTGGFGTTAGQANLFQIIDISGGDVGDLISEGNAFFNLSAYFSTYREQYEASTVSVIFLDGGGDEVGGGDVGGQAFIDTLEAIDGQVEWGQDTVPGAVPSNAVTAIVSISAGSDATNHDGYVDLIDFQVTAVVPPPLPFSITSPGDGTFVNSLSFVVDWDDAILADAYSIVIADNADLDNPIVEDSGLIDSEYAVEVGSGVGTGVWFVQVEAINEAGTSAADNGPIEFGVINPCAGDANHDGVKNILDFVNFQQIFLATCP